MNNADLYDGDDLFMIRKDTDFYEVTTGYDLCPFHFTDMSLRWSFV